MVALDVLLDLHDQLVVRLRSNDLSALAVDHLAHPASFREHEIDWTILRLDPWQNLGAPSCYERHVGESLLTSVLFTDIVGSSETAARLGNRRWTELLATHNDSVRQELRRHSGTELDTAGDGFLASFASPGDAVRCGRDIVASMRPIGIDIRAGVHIGECELIGGKPAGIPIHVGSRIAAAAKPNHVFVSRTVRELLAGSELEFVDEGTHALKGIPGDWHLFSVSVRATEAPAVRVQLCGRLSVEIDGTQLAGRLPGRQGRTLLAYLVVNRRREVSRGQLIDAIWPDEPPSDADAGLSALLSKLRRVLGTDRVEGRHTVRLVLTSATWVDLEAAAEALHRAESAVKREDWKQAWSSARVTLHVGQRSFLAGEDGPWIDDVRRDLQAWYIRSLEITATASLEIGGSEMDTAERSARTLIKHAPFSESGYRFLMRVYEARDNRAEGLLVYEQLRTMLRRELGATPSAPTQELHRRLLA
jgi:SARP family transcriptional regulator, regulator of embCAB operon